MRTLITSFVIVSVILATLSCNSQKKVEPGESVVTDLQGNVNNFSNLPFDSALVSPFYQAYPELAKYEKDVLKIYRDRGFNQIWFDQNGIIEFGNSLYGKVIGLSADGISSSFPYQDKVDGIFVDQIENVLNTIETELMISNLFLFYAEKVYKGISEDSTRAIGWLMPRKQLTYSSLLDSVLLNPQLFVRNENTLFPQYFKLREVLQKYREIEKNGGWNPIDLDPKLKAYKPGDTALAILQIRERLFVTGDISQNNKSNLYDTELVSGVQKYQLRNGFKPDSLISPKHIKQMNVPIGERIKQIMVNMERCRWISPEIVKAKEFIVVNIPSYKLNLFRDGKSDFESAVVVGAVMTKTVIFSGNMSYIVFSPYWNIPQSIIVKDVKPGMKKNPNYLASHNMEWNNGLVRQKPGKNNSLGLVKFIFPNSNNIYLHDTPSKSLFERDSRAFSHGCIRVGKPRDLAITILKDDPNWTPAKIDKAMNAGKESSYTLKHKIPVHIGYFTAWVNESGEINFYEDIYERDGRLANLLMDSEN
ncbi:MAG: L,D-transpeptidase family protein [Bacteroidales bacterium]